MQIAAVRLGWDLRLSGSGTVLPDAHSRFYSQFSRLGFLVPYLDYFLVPLFALFLLVALYGWMCGGEFRQRK